MTRPLAEIFDAYGDDAKAGLAAWANLNPESWSAYVDAAAERQYRGDYAVWRRRLISTAQQERVAEDNGQARLFEPPEPGALTDFRQRVVLDGIEHDMADLEGADGAAVIRKVAERDLAPAVTTVSRCRSMLKLADHMDAETERLGRPVSAGEVLGWAA